MTTESDPAAPSEPAASPTRIIRSEDLLAGAKTVVIQHAGEFYRLLVTKNDKLILQK